MKLSFSIAAESDAAELAALHGAVAEDLTRRYGRGAWSSATTEKGVLNNLRKPKFSQMVMARNAASATLLKDGTVLVAGGEGQSFADLETAKKLAPDHDATYFQLSQAYRRAGRVQEAEETLTAYQKLIEANRLRKRKALEADKP